MKNVKHSLFRKNIRWLAPLLFLTLIAFFFIRDEAGAKSKKVTRTPPALPVETAMVEQGDVPIYVEALGTVTPIASVSIISRVQGQLLQVNYQEGQLVKKGDSLVEIDPAPFEAALAQAEGQTARDQALLKEAKIDMERYQKAYQLHAVSKQQFEDQQQLVAQDEGIVKSDLGTLANAKINLSYCHIRSPIDGRVGLRLVDAGNMVQANSTTPLVVVTQIAPITVVFNVAEDYLGEIQAQQIARAKDSKENPDSAMVVEALDRSHEKKIATGKFLTLDNTIDPTTGTVKVKAIFDNQDGALFPNQFVNAKLLIDTVHGANLLTTAAIQRNEKGPFVYVISKDNTAKVQNIKIGTVSGDNTEVQGLNSGEVVASAGFDKLQDGAKVKPENAQKEKP
jgi:multidrug efflux system membrane fusion protein